MGAPLASQVLFAAGGDVLSKYGTLLWRKGLQARGGEIPYTFTRSGNGLYLANDVALGGLKVLTAGAGLARVEQLIDPVSGILQNYLKLEAGTTNWCLRSQELATGNPAGPPWSTNLLTATNNVSAAPDGTVTATGLVPTAVSSNQHYAAQAITCTASEFVAASGFYKANGYTAVTIRITDGASNQFTGVFDLLNGVTGSSQAVGVGTSVSGASIIKLAGGWYWCGVWGTNGASTTQNMRVFAFDNLADANASTAFTGDGTSGVFAWGAQLERNGTTPTVAPPPTSYVATAAATANRTLETFKIPFFIGPNAAPRWIYVRWLPRGEWAAGAAQFPGVVTIGSFTAPNWRTQIYNDRGLGQYVGTDGNSSIGQAVSTATGVSPTFGQALEALLLTTAGGVNVVRMSINGAADIVGSTSSARTLQSDYGLHSLSLGDDSAYPMSNFLISRVLVGLQGTGPLAVSQIADVRNIL